MAKANHEQLIWIDLEMTGLMPDSDQIIEIATVLTDKDLNILAEGPELAIHQPEEVLARMDAWNQRQHASSGLLARVRSSRMTVTEAERQTLLFLSSHLPPGASPMCGNSICPGSALPGALDARARTLFPLSLSGCQHAQGARASLDARVGFGLLQARGTSGAGRHLRVTIGELRYYRERMFVKP